MQANKARSDQLGRPAFWAEQFSRLETDTVRTKSFAARRAIRALEHPQAFGNYFTYGTAAAIVAAQQRAPFIDGTLRLADQYCDFGYMWCQLGAPESALAALSQPFLQGDFEGYPPDLSDELRTLVAEMKFGRRRSSSFDVLGTEGAQGAIGYAFLAFLNPGDEVLITDPGYMHFATAPRLAGARVRAIALSSGNGFRLDPDEVAANIGPRTRMLVLCDPINPFGTVQRKDELLAILRICEERQVLVLNNITHSTHQLRSGIAHVAASTLACETSIDHVLSITGVSKGYALAGLRLGFLAGHPALLRAAAQVRMEITGIHIHPSAQPAAMAALSDTQYVPDCTEVLRRNLIHLRETVRRSSGEVVFAVEPDYGFSTCLDVSATNVSAQELTVALFEQGICVLAGDALGENAATRLVRLNYSARSLRNLERLRLALPLAVRHAQSGRYRPSVEAFYRAKRGRRAKEILRQLETIVSRPRPFLSSSVCEPCVPSVEPSVRTQPEPMRRHMLKPLPPSFVSQAQLTYGPLDVLSRFFASAYRTAADYGVHLAFGSFDELLRVNLANQSSWRALIPTFDRRLSNLTEDNAFCILGYDMTGEVVATQACRLFDWQDKTFKTAAEDLSLFYSHAEWDRQPNETCEVTAASAALVSGRVAFSGGAWYRRDFRGKYLSLIMPRISRAYAFTRWSTDYTASMIQDSVLASGMGKRCGYSNVEWGVRVNGSPMGNIDFAFVWMEPAELVEDLLAFEGTIGTEADRSVWHRRA